MRASNLSRLEDFAAAVCRIGCAAPPARERLDRLLELLIDETQARYGYVIEAPASGPACVARAAGLKSRRHGSGDVPLSRGALRWAAAAKRPMLLGPEQLGSIATASLRALDLRWMAAAPFSSDQAPGVLLLDGSESLELSPAQLHRRVCIVRGAVQAILSDGAAGATPQTALDATSDPVGNHPAWRAALDWADRLAPTGLPVWIYGESGSGKELVALRLHRRGRGGPFVALNCAALPDSLIESELFGAEAGAYTGAQQARIGLFRQADGGTLFLDEVAEMSAAMQAKLLRTLEQSTVRPVGGDHEVAVDCRLICASHRDLRAAVRAGAFRTDLFYRLATAQVKLPPLRGRRSDLPVLVRALAPRVAQRTGRPAAPLTPAAWDRLRVHHWPGNVRELFAVLCVANVRCRGTAIDADDLELFTDSAETHNAETHERELILQALEATAENVTRAARRLGWSRPKLYRAMQRHRIERVQEIESGRT